MGEVVEIRGASAVAPCGCTALWGVGELLIETCPVHHNYAQRQLIKLVRKLAIPLPEVPA